MRKLFAILVCGMMMVSSLAVMINGVAGSGTPSVEPNLTVINDVFGLQAMSGNLGEDYQLGNDIDASATVGWNGGEGFVPVGTTGTPFTGSLDGQGYTISNLYINRPGVNHQGLFGYLHAASSVTDVRLVDVDISGEDDTGALVGEAFGPITDSYATGSVMGDQRVGGLVGRYGGANTISNCHFTGDVDGTDNTGGLVGSSSAQITNCYSTGTVAGFWTTGGLVGFFQISTISDSFSVSTVNGGGGNSFGGLVGWNLGTIIDCHSNGSVFGNIDVGGLIGNNGGGTTVMNCYNTGQTQGTGNDVGGLIGDNSGIVMGCYNTGQTQGTGNDVGGLIGENSGPVSYCYNTGDVTWGDNYVGGLAGYHDGSMIMDCYNTGNINGNIGVGGLVGYNFGPINTSYSTGDVSASTVAAGGAFGYHRDYLAANCYATGDIMSGAGGASGFVEQMLLSASIMNCYSSGKVNGGTNGFVQWFSGSIENCTFDNQTSGQLTSNGGVTGNNTADMMTQATFANWDFITTWWMIDGETRPFLRWEYNTSIRTSHQLQMMHMDLTVDYTLVDDVNASDTSDPADMWGTSPASGAGFYPIGVTGTEFTGSLEGMGHTISNLYMKNPGAGMDSVGLFGYLFTSTVNDVHLVDVNVSGGGMYVGGLVGTNRGTVTNSSVEGYVYAGSDNAGLLVGRNWLGIIDYCWSSGLLEVNNGYGGGLVGRNDQGFMYNSWSDARTEVPSQWYVGGLIGYNNWATVTNCTAFGTTIGQNRVGGLIGSSNNGVITDCYSTGYVDGSAFDVGGLIGYNFGGATVTRCYSSCYVDGAGASFGGLIGNNDTSTVTDCYWDNQTTNQPSSDGGTGKYTADLMQQATYVGWDFTNTWFMIEGQTRPFLRMEYDSDIYSSHQVQLMCLDLAADYEIGCDIDMNITDPARMWSAEGFVPVARDLDSGNSFFLGTNFTGTLDGNDYQISGLYINRPTNANGFNQGLFGGMNGTIQDLTIDGNVDGYLAVGLFTAINLGTITGCTAGGSGVALAIIGGFVGENFGTVSDSENTCLVTSKPNGWHMGGIVGRNNGGGNITDCINSVVITGVQKVGGIAGGCEGGNVEGCFNSGDITSAPWDRGGGIIGEHRDGNVSQCHNTGDIDGHAAIGGVVGYSQGSTLYSNCTSTGSVTVTWGRGGGFVGEHYGESIIRDCWSTGAVNGAGLPSMGGFVGDNYATIKDCWSSGDVDGSDNTGGFAAQNIIIFDGFGDLQDCNSSGDVNGAANTGGFVGFNTNNITGCNSTGITSGTDRVGGLIGYNQGPVTDCKAYGEVNTTGTMTGGLIGRSDGSTITDSEAHGLVYSTDSETGGFIGFTSSAVIRNSSSHGRVIGAVQSTGGLIGAAGGVNDIDNCSVYSHVESSGPNTGGFIGDIPSTQFYINNSHVFNNTVGTWATGGFIGRSQVNGFLGNSTVNCEVIGAGNIGGFIGHQIDGHIFNCTSQANVSFNGDRAGGFIGNLQGGNIESSFAMGAVSGTGGSAGGFAGQNAGGTISGCKASGNATGTTSMVGGFIGRNFAGSINTSYATGIATSSGNDVGGFVGDNDAAIDNCYAWGNASGVDNIGGFFGRHSASGTIDDCYSAGDQAGSNSVGGFGGIRLGVLPTNCFWDNQTSSRTWTGAGVGKYTIDMMSQATFDPPWDFTTIWGMYEANSYPLFQPVAPMVIETDLNVTCEVIPTFVNWGEYIHFYANITNDGPDNAVGVNLTIHVEGGNLNITQAVPGYSFWGMDNLSWDLGILMNGESVSVFVNATAEDMGIFYDNGTVTSTTTDPDLTNNNYTVVVQLNTPPTANGDSNSTDEDTILFVDAPGLFANDTDPDTPVGDFISLDSFDNPSTLGAAVIVNANGSYSFDPTGVAAFQALAVGESLIDTFDYTIIDTKGNTSTATVSITVNGMNDAPTAVDDTYTVDEDSALAVPAAGVLTNDLDDDTTDVLNVTTSDNTSTLGAAVNVSADGSFTYDTTGIVAFQAVAVGEVLVDTFNYTVGDGNSGFDTATVTINVTGVNDLPVITNTDVIMVMTGQVYSNDYDATDVDTIDTHTWALASNTSWLTINSATGIISYTTTNADAGEYWVNITVTDNNGGKDWSNFSLSVLLDTDGDGIPDITDLDDDGDGTADLEDDLPKNDNETTDTDDDGIGNNADPDDDNDGWNDTDEITAGTDPLDDTDVPADNDGDGISDVADPDDDNDGEPDVTDDFDFDANETNDADGDSIGDNADPDDDNDGTPDTEDDFDFDPTEDTDTDGDGIGNNADTDDDNDGWNDTIELEAGNDPLDDTSVPTDADGNGIPDVLEEPPETTGGLMDYWWIIVILIIAIVLGLVLFMMKKGKGLEPDLVDKALKAEERHDHLDDETNGQEPDDEEESENEEEPEDGSEDEEESSKGEEETSANDEEQNKSIDDGLEL